MSGARLFILAVVLLQLGAVVSYATRRQWPQAVMFFGAAVANGAAGFIR